jgi:uncharacterized protein YecA (UPF0149 family)
MVGWQAPELKEWQQHAAKEHARLKKLLSDPALMKMIAQVFTDQPQAEETPAEIPEPPEHVPFRRESPKIGRNDPCPCGSGKKYKKCCGCKRDD